MHKEPNPSFHEETEEAISDRIRRDMKKYVHRANFSFKDKMMIAARKLADEGHTAYLAGQITARAQDGQTFWSTDFTRNFGEITAADLVRFDRQMRVVEGNCMPNPAVRFHLWIYEQRPDIQVIIHTHAPFASALSMLGEELIIAHMDAMMFYEDCAFLPDWPGLPLGNSEGELISAALGAHKKCALLAHHGIIVGGKSIEEALYLIVMLENAARLQIRASSVGPIRPVDESLAPPAQEFLMRDSVVNLTFDSWGRMILD